MKTWAKIAVGCLIVLVVLCLVLAGTFIFAGAWLKSKLGGLFGGAYDTGKNIAAIQKLNEQYPFREPADGGLREDRLQAFLAVNQQVKTVAGPLKADLESKGGEKPGMEEVKKAAAATAAITGALKTGLEAAKMSPAEYRWIAATAYEALESAGGAVSGGDLQGQEGLQAMAQASIEVLQSQLNDPSLTAEQRQALEQQIAEIQAQSGQAPTGQPTGNAALVEQYRSQLEATDVRGVVEMGLPGAEATPHGS